MVAFQAAADMGAEGIEFDVQLSKDDVPVVIHDLTLNRTTTGQGLVRHFTVAELKTYSAGSWHSDHFKTEKIPTLEEVLIWAQPLSLTLNLELKGDLSDRDRILASVLPLLNKYDLEDRIILSSFDHKTVHRFQQEDPFLETAVIVTAALYKPEDYLKCVNVKSFHFSYLSLLGEEIEELTKKGFRLRPYTVNDETWIKKFIEMGCDAIFTDEVEKALQIRGNFFSRKN